MMFAERRSEMDKQSLPSIEKFAAYLDGKLSPDEMQQFSQLAEHNDALRQLLDASARLDELMTDSTEMELPPEIASSEFDIPDIPADIPVDFAKSTFESWDEMFSIAAAIESNDELSHHSEITSDNDIDIDASGNLDSMLNLSPENDNDGIMENDDSSSFTPDGI